MENVIKPGLIGKFASGAVVTESGIKSEIPEIYASQAEKYRKLNKVARKNGVVFFGSTFSRSIPVCELRQAFDLDCDIYNRSFDDLTVTDAANLYETCAAELNPSKVMIQIGETELERGFKTIPEIINSYENLINTIRKHDRHCRIIVVSVCETGTGVQPAELNRQLEAMTEKHKCSFADISPAFSNDSPDVKAFSLLRCFMRDRITFSEAMNMAF